MQEILQMIIKEISRADIKDPLTYGIVMTGGGAELRNISSLIEHNLNVKVRKGKPNENHSIYYVFARLGHEKSANFPIKSHEELCLQSKHAF